MLLDRLELSASGRPLLGPGEYERLMVEQVDLHFPDAPGGPPDALAERHAGGNVLLTTHRLCWLDAAAAPAAGASCALALAAVAGAGIRAKHIFAVPRLCLRVCVDGTGRPAAADAPDLRQCEASLQRLELPVAVALASQSPPLTKAHGRRTSLAIILVKRTCCGGELVSRTAHCLPPSAQEAMLGTVPLCAAASAACLEPQRLHPTLS